MSTLTIYDALKAKGVEVTEVETVKNGIVCKGYQINTGNDQIRPVIYFSETETVDAFVERALKIAEQPAPDIKVENLITRERLLQETYLCLQKRGGEDIVKRDFLNLELYVRMSVDMDMGDRNNIASLKVTPQMLEMAEVSENELFEAAQKNSLDKARIFSMAEALGLPEELAGDDPFSIGTYDNKCHGLAVMALSEMLHEYAEKKGQNGMYLIPSSTEEVLLVSEGLGDPNSLAQMVNEVNETTVDPILQLDPVVYYYDDVTRKVSIASTYERGC